MTCTFADVADAVEFKTAGNSFDAVSYVWLKLLGADGTDDDLRLAVRA
jgi:hypothetical protein